MEKMKKLYLFFAMLAAITFLFVSCENIAETEIPPVTKNLTTGDADVAAAGSPAVVAVVETDSPASVIEIEKPVVYTSSISGIPVPFSLLRILDGTIEQKTDFPNGFVPPDAYFAQAQTVNSEKYASLYPVSRNVYSSIRNNGEVAASFVPMGTIKQGQLTLNFPEIPEERLPNFYEYFSLKNRDVERTPGLRVVELKLYVGASNTRSAFLYVKNDERAVGFQKSAVLLYANMDGYVFDKTFNNIYYVKKGINFYFICQESENAEQRKNRPTREGRILSLEEFASREPYFSFDGSGLYTTVLIENGTKKLKVPTVEGVLIPYKLVDGYFEVEQKYWDLGLEYTDALIETGLSQFKNYIYVAPRLQDLVNQLRGQGMILSDEALIELIIRGYAYPLSN
jgi:hypothetical protein